MSAPRYEFQIPADALSVCPPSAVGPAVVSVNIATSRGRCPTGIEDSFHHEPVGPRVDGPDRNHVDVQRITPRRRGNVHREERAGGDGRAPRTASDEPADNAAIDGTIIPRRDGRWRAPGRTGYFVVDGAELMASNSMTGEKRAARVGLPRYCRGSCVHQHGVSTDDEM